MLTRDIRERDFDKEWIFTASRSSGPGGQNVNKVSTRMELRFHVDASQLLSEEEKSKVSEVLRRYINKDGVLILVSQTERSQYRNKEKAIDRFYRLVEKALTPVKKRKTTRPTVASRRRRTENKKLLSEKKSLRRVISDENS
jgi:ribosome-associated protein